LSPGDKYHLRFSREDYFGEATGFWSKWMSGVKGKLALLRKPVYSVKILGLFWTIEVKL
jgi:hypothetical protein